MGQKNSFSTELALSCAVVGMVSAFLSHKMTTVAMTRAEQMRRLERAKEESEQKVIRNKKQNDEGFPSGSTDDGMKIDQIYVWDLEDLKTRFPSEG